MTAMQQSAMRQKKKYSCRPHVAGAGPVNAARITFEVFNIGDDDVIDTDV
jgi:hypothetical protein